MNLVRSVEGDETHTQVDKEPDAACDCETSLFRSSDDVRDGFIRGAQSFDVKPVRYNVIDGVAIFEGDIALGTPEQVDEVARAVRDGAPRPEGDVAHAVGITGAQFRWPGGVVPWTSTAALRPLVLQAIQHWEASTRLRFPERTGANAAGFPDWLSFEALDGCWSHVGRQGGMQVISLGGGCGFGAAVHEIGHAIGLWHEQSREDRDAHVRINWANIEPGREHNFNQHITDGDDIGGYDFGSIMHYGPTAFSRNGLPTIEPLSGQTVGQRDGLSLGDIAAVRALYPDLEPRRLAKAAWMHGSGVEVEFPDRIASEWRAGFFTRLEGQPGTTNWLHFAIATPVIVSDQRLFVGSVMLRFRSNSPQAFVNAVHVFDGEARIAAHDGLRLAPSDFGFDRFDVGHRPHVFWGLGITVGVSFEGESPEANRIEFAAAGCDFLGLA